MNIVFDIDISYRNVSIYHDIIIYRDIIFDISRYFTPSWSWWHKAAKNSSSARWVWLHHSTGDGSAETHC